MDPVLLLRHTLAALAYRSLRAVHRAPADFAAFRAGATSRSAGEILAHMGDLMDWAARLLAGDRTWRVVPPGDWETGKERFFASLTRFDLALKERGAEADHEVLQRLFQGPIADALTHTGQLMLLRGLAGSPVTGENYFVADIVPGRTTMIQPPPVRTF